MASHKSAEKRMRQIVKRTADSWYRARYGDTSRGRVLRRLIRLWL